jgi:hypothetical protein
MTSLVEIYRGSGYVVGRLTCIANAEPLPEFGPEYPELGPAVAKWRRLAGKRDLTPAEKRAYGDAFEASIKAKQRQALLGPDRPAIAPRCASGTWHNTPEAIESAIRQILAFPAQARRARTPEEWSALYDAAMEEKRDREAGEAVNAAALAMPTVAPPVDAEAPTPFVPQAPIEETPPAATLSPAHKATAPHRAMKAAGEAPRRPAALRSKPAAAGRASPRLSISQNAPTCFLERG